MTADILTMPQRGRPSKARLAEIQERADDSRDELRAMVLEGVELAARLLLVVRRAERAVAAGRSCATDLDEIERIALRHGTRMAAAATEARDMPVCPCGSTVRHLGCGKAA